MWSLVVACFQVFAHTNAHREAPKRCQSFGLVRSGPRACGKTSRLKSAWADVAKDVGSISTRMFEAFLVTVLGKWVLAALFFYFYVQACFWLLTNVGGFAAFVLFGLLTWALMAVAGWVIQKFRT